MKEIAEHPHKTRVPPPRGQQSHTDATPVADPDGVQSNGSKLVFTMKATTGNKDSGKAKPTISGFGHSGGKRSAKGKPEATRRRESQHSGRTCVPMIGGGQEGQETKEKSHQQGRREARIKGRKTKSKGKEPPAKERSHRPGWRPTPGAGGMSRVGKKG